MKIYTYLTLSPANRSRHTHSIKCLNNDRGNLAHIEAGRSLTSHRHLTNTSHTAHVRRATYYACAQKSSTRASHCACAKNSKSHSSVGNVVSQCSIDGMES